MFRRLTSRRTLKWTGTVVCTLFASLFVASLWISAFCGFRVGTYLIFVGAFEGHVGFNLTDGSIVGSQASLSDAMATKIRFRSSPVITWWSPLIESPPRPSPYLCIVILPVWLPLLILLLPTLLLWRLDRRRPLHNHCRNCNYNLTANTSGRCPECGAEVLKPDADIANESRGSATGV